ncbi:MAG TPA: FAD-dependent oxidoreductase [Bryobacteraceae bacterium]|nr:FAD-dependent oxidoreductase [Bryobacteraceae bacterium]
MSTVANWPPFMARLTGRHEAAENTMAFQFEKPAGWTFKPGQFVDITLMNPPETDAEGNSRAFSISSAPQEPKIMVTTRLRNSAFKRVLKNMSLQSEVKIEGPFGNLILHNNTKRPAVLLAGGIGITPFRSIVVNAAKEKLPHRIFLFYSNRRPEDAAFLEELQTLETQNANYKLIATMTEIEKSARSWKGEVGLINYQMVDRYLKAVASPDWYTAGPIYYIAGPAQMVRDLQAMVTNAGVDSDDVRIEEFSGY